MAPQEHMPPAPFGNSEISGAGNLWAMQPESTGVEIPPPTEVRQIETSDGFAATMETWQLGNRDVVRVTPIGNEADTIRSEQPLPLYVALGIHGDRRLHWALTAFAQEYSGPTIGILYRRPEGSSRLVTTSGYEPPVPELEAIQADDLIAALDMLHITQVNAYTESRGNTRVEVAAEKRPDLFAHRYHQDPVGHDGEGFIGTHQSARRIAMAGLRRKLRRNEEVDPLVSELRAQGIPSRKPRHSLRVRRREQKSVARTHHARLGDIATKNQYAPARSVTYAGDVGDTGIIATKLRQRIESIQATGNGVRYIETNKGRHGIGQRRSAVRHAARHFRSL